MLARLSTYALQFGTGSFLGNSYCLRTAKHSKMDRLHVPMAGRARHPLRRYESTLGIETLPHQSGVYVARRLIRERGPRRVSANVAAVTR